MRIIKWIIISISLLMIFSIIFFVYSGLNGNPIKKYYFKKEVEKYLIIEYPSSEFVINSIGYGFKEMNYYGDVSPNNNKNLHFMVEKNYQGKLYDTLQEATREFIVNQKCESKLKQFFEDSSCNTDVFGSKIIISINTDNNKDTIDKYKKEMISFINSISDLI